GAVQFVQAGVQRGCLPGPGRPSDQEDAVRTFDDVLELHVVLFREPQVADADLNVAPVEDAHDGGLAVDRREHTHSKVEVLPVDTHLDAAVLRAALFADVDTPHDLKATQQ